MSRSRKIQRDDLTSSSGSWDQELEEAFQPGRSQTIRYRIPARFRSLQDGRIRNRGVDLILSRRTKSAMNTHYNDYSDDEEDNVSDQSDEDDWSEDDYDDEIYDDNEGYGQYGYYRVPYHENYFYDEENEDDYDDDEPRSMSFPLLSAGPRKTIRTISFAEAANLPSRNSTVSSSIPTVSKPLKKRANIRHAVKSKTKKPKASANRTGPITRSRRAAMVDDKVDEQ